jgi:hypothetical protein
MIMGLRPFRGRCLGVQPVPRTAGKPHEPISPARPDCFTIRPQPLVAAIPGPDVPAREKRAVLSPVILGPTPCFQLYLLTHRSATSCLDLYRADRPVGCGRRRPADRPSGLPRRARDVEVSAALRTWRISSS